MIHAGGILLILIGGVLFHIAASDKNITSPQDIWKDMLDTLQVGQ